MKWSGKRVLVTGHTGFKGGWLSLWLQQKGAALCGFALEQAQGVSLFEDAKVGSGMRSVIGDIRNVELLKRTFAEHRPEILFHLAAQPLVRRSYESPLETYSTNVMGTANVLEAARNSEGLRAVVIVTTDKCYEEREGGWPYRETDRLGGYDPYSNSKACAELVVSSYRNSFFHPSDYCWHGVAIASVRAGNVIGGGDWSADRLVPDIIRALTDGREVRIRNPHSVRPWQHVLEPLRGYLQVAESLFDDGVTSGEAWNFGPDEADALPVEWIVNELTKLWGNGGHWERGTGMEPHEGQSLRLDCSKVAQRLGWRPVLCLKDGLQMTAAWYRARLDLQEMNSFTIGQIKQYEERANTRIKTAAASCEVPA